MGVNVDALLSEIEIVYRRLKKSSYPDSSSSGRSCDAKNGKDNSRATEYRNQGNVVYRRGDYWPASVFYTMSASSATENSEELSLAYGNRSAALLRLGEYVPCLLDINRALKGKYPKYSRKKLQDRKKMCLVEIAKMEGVKIVGDETDPIESTAINNKESKIPRGKLDNPLLPYTSSKIELAYDEKWGRHWVAADDIEPGEILSCEPLFVKFRPNSIEIELSNCSYCLIRCAALISCHSCSDEMYYCSERCRDRAFNAYHRTECRMWPFIMDESSEENKLNEALRMLFVGTEQGAKLQHLTANLSVRDLFKENVDIVNKPYAGDYSSILQIHRPFDQPTETAVTLAVKAIIWLQELSFFENHPDPNSMSETEKFVTLALLNHLQSVIAHNFGISELAMTPDSLPHAISSEKKFIGTGIGALHNLVNHSCDPNVEYVHTQAQEQLLFSVKPIKQGEQIFMTYCTFFAKEPLVERMFKLSCYGFTCYCEACAHDWPSLDDMFAEKPKFFTNDKQLIADITKKILKLIYDGVKEKNIRKIIRCRKLIHEYVRSPSFLSCTCELILVKLTTWTYSNLCYVKDDVAVGDIVAKRTLSMVRDNLGI